MSRRIRNITIYKFLILSMKSLWNSAMKFNTLLFMIFIILFCLFKSCRIFLWFNNTKIIYRLFYFKKKSFYFTLIPFLHEDYSYFYISKKMYSDYNKTILKLKVSILFWKLDKKSLVNSKNKKDTPNYKIKFLKV